MADPLDRDRSIEHLLRQTLRASAPTTPCLDAEQLAAWVTGALAQLEAEAAERHLADCIDCQAMLAAFADSDPAPASVAAPVVLPFSQRWSATWLLPAAAAAAAVLVWVMVPRDPSELPQAATTMARVEEQSAAAPPAAVARGPESSLQSRGAATAVDPPMPVGPRLQPGRSLAQETPSSNASNQARQASGAEPLAEPAAVERRFDVGAVQGPLAAKSGAATAVAAAPPPPPQAPLPTATPPLPAASFERSSGNSTVADASPRRAFSGAEAAPISPSAMDTAVRADLPVHAQTGGQRAVGFSAPASGATAAGVRAAAPLVAWQIEVDGRVARSVDGASWTPVPLAPSTFITAGSAPTPGVCWLAGRDGIVFRSTDDATFVRVAFPELEVVAAIQAQDASTATVTLVGGRVFATVDGGRSWRTVP